MLFGELAEINGKEYKRRGSLDLEQKPSAEER